MINSEGSFVTVVSGLPRSGTSMIMQMLEAGGLPTLSDGCRAADEDNPRGYYELEAVMRTKDDRSWLAAAAGKAVKVIYRLLHKLPTDRRYRVVFIRRNLEEVVCSQTAMLSRSGSQGATVSDENLVGVFQRQLDKCDLWLAEQPHFEVLHLEYGNVIRRPKMQARRIRDFLGLPLNVAAMAQGVEPALHRQRGPR